MKLNILTLIAFAASVLAKTGPGAAIHLGDVEQNPTTNEAEAPVLRILVPACGGDGAPPCAPACGGEGAPPCAPACGGNGAPPCAPEEPTTPVIEATT